MAIDAEKSQQQEQLTALLTQAGCDGAFVKDLWRLTADPRFRSTISLHLDDPTSEGAAAAAQLLACFHKRLPSTELPATMRSIFGSLTQQLGYGSSFNLDDALDPRPPEEHLLDGLRAFLRALEHFRTPGRTNKMVNVDAGTEELQGLYTKIDFSRHLLRLSMRFTQTVLANLSVMESRAWRLMKTGYDRVRTAAETDEEMFDLLEDTETCLYGGAQKAADRRRMNVSRDAQVAAETERKLRLAGGGMDAGGNVVGGELSAFFNAVRRLMTPPSPQAPTDDRTAPR